jgi:precorrin-6Y C5,15-methyltransferase (decarboxylating) CbiT subunit
VRPGDANHAVNVVAGGPPPWLREALERALGGVAAYPDEREAVAALAALHGRAPTRSCRPTARPRRCGCCPRRCARRSPRACTPAFTEAEAALRAHGVPVVRVLRDPGRAFALDPRACARRGRPRGRRQPGAATGTLDPAAALLALRRPGRTVVVDEAFMDMVPGEPGSLVRESLPDVVVVRSLTKTLAVPGLRAGYAVTAPRRTPARRAPAVVGQRARAGGDECRGAAARRVRRRRQRVTEEREDLARRLRSIPGVRTWPSSANYCLVEVPDGPRVDAALRDGGIAVRPAASFPGLGPNHLRITARAAAENERLAEALGRRVGERAGSSPWWGSAPMAGPAWASRPRRRSSRPTRSSAPGASSHCSRHAGPSAAVAVADRHAGGRDRRGPGRVRLRAGQRRPDAARDRGDPRAPSHDRPARRPSALLRVRACLRAAWLARGGGRAGQRGGAPAGGDRRARCSQVAASSRTRRARTGRLGSHASCASAAFGRSRFVVLEQLGGATERIVETTAQEWGEARADPLHAVAIECRGAPATAAAPGLPDDAYDSDGALTKWPVRAVTLAALRPGPQQLLWDVGAGSGSIAIEWLRAEPLARALAIESRADRAARIAANALQLGVPRLEVREGTAPAALRGLDPPDAVFVGGGVSAPGLLAACWHALRPGGRLVANAVTLEGEQALHAARAAHGGTLTRWPSAMPSLSAASRRGVPRSPSSSGAWSADRPLHRRRPGGARPAHAARAAA